MGEETLSYTRSDVHGLAMMMFLSSKAAAHERAFTRVRARPRAHVAANFANFRAASA